MTKPESVLGGEKLLEGALMLQLRWETLKIIVRKLADKDWDTLDERDNKVSKIAFGQIKELVDDLEREYS